MSNFASRLLGKGKGKGKKKDRDHSGGSPSDSQRGSLENVTVPPSGEVAVGASLKFANILVENKVDVASTSQRTNKTAVDTSSKKPTPAPEPSIASPSGGQRAREAAIILLEFGSIISGATDLLKPMKVACLFMKKVLEVAKVSISPLARPLAGLITISLFTNFIQDVEQVDQGWKGLIDRIKFHIMTIQSQTKSLEDDQSMDEGPPPFDSGIMKPLQEYIK
jgi:hypothetical protein